MGQRSLCYRLCYTSSYWIFFLYAKSNSFDIILVQFDPAEVNKLHWHYRLGHIPFSYLQKFTTMDNSTHCTICPLAKQHKPSFPIHLPTSTACFQLLHIDIWGLSGIPTVDGNRYFLTIVDDYSKYTWIFLLANKNNARLKLQHFCVLVET